MLLLITISFSQRINLNSTSIGEMQTLDLTLEQIENIVTFRERSGQINSIYELRRKLLLNRLLLNRLLLPYQPELVWFIFGFHFRSPRFCNFFSPSIIT